MSETIKMDFYVAKRLIRELNAKELKRKWNKFLKEQEAKHGHKATVGDVKERPEALDKRTTAYGL